jgi:hypothetical protein
MILNDFFDYYDYFNPANHINLMKISGSDNFKIIIITSIILKSQFRQKEKGLAKNYPANPYNFAKILI